MKTDVMTLSLLMVAGTPAAAMAQGCTEAETALRAEAGVLGPMLTELSTITSDYNAKQKAINDLYDYLYYYYVDMTMDEAQMVRTNEADMVVLKGRYDALVAKAQPHDAKVTSLIQAYETACSPNAKTAELLNEYDIVVLPKQPGQ